VGNRRRGDHGDPDRPARGVDGRGRQDLHGRAGSRGAGQQRRQGEQRQHERRDDEHCRGTGGTPHDEPTVPPDPVRWQHTRVTIGRRAELAGWAALVAAALVVRLVDLGDRPFQHDEAQIAYFSWLFAQTGDYAYEPVLHGPLMYHAQAAFFRILGDGDFVARLPMALAGLAVTALAFGLRSSLGRAAAFVAGLLFAFGPTFLYYSRFEREDIIVAAVTLALLIALGELLERPRPALAPIIGALLALSFTLKESTYITVAVVGSFLAGMAAWQRRSCLRDTPVARAPAVPDRRGWWLAAGLFALVYAALFTTFGTNPGGLWDAVYGGPRYWLDQQPINRGGERWGFHLLLLSSLEWPVLLFGLVGLAAVFRRPTPMTALLAWTFVASLAIYSWASERFAWLTLHPLLALVPLAAVGLVSVARAPSALVRGGGLALAVAGAAYLGLSSWVANGAQRVDPRSLLVAPQTTEAALGVRDELLILDRRLRHVAGRPLSVDVDSNDSFSFPWAWYLRDMRTGFLDMRAAGYRPQTDAVIVSDGARAQVALGAYRGRRFALRAFWGRDYRRLSVGGWWRWITRREPWSPLGTSSGWLYVRRDLALGPEPPRARGPRPL
jgi:uncharacterized protein (TIGR03663 family)